MDECPFFALPLYNPNGKSRSGWGVLVLLLTMQDSLPETVIDMIPWQDYLISAHYKNHGEKPQFVSDLFEVSHKVERFPVRR